VGLGRDFMETSAEIASSGKNSCSFKSSASVLLSRTLSIAIFSSCQRPLRAQ